MQTGINIFIGLQLLVPGGVEDVYDSVERRCFLYFSGSRGLVSGVRGFGVLPKAWASETVMATVSGVSDANQRLTLLGETAPPAPHRGDSGGPHPRIRTLQVFFQRAI